MRTALALILLLTAPAQAEGILGTWAGEYTCGQGLTGMTLTISEQPDGNARALAYFYPVTANPDVPWGCFTLRGTYDPATGEAVLRQEKWLVKPERYGMADLEGTVSPNGATFTGKVTRLMRCTTFAFDRETEPKPTPAACSPSLLLSMRR